MKAVILAGGMGTRLRPLTNEIPKPLVPLLGKPLIRYIIDALPDEVDQVLIAVSYRKDDLQRYFEEHDLGLDVVLVEEKEPLGTGGALKNVSPYLDDTFLAFNGDIISSLDLRAFVDFHRRKKGIGALALWRVEDPSAYGVVSMEGERISSFLEKPPPDESPSDMINAGIYIFEQEILDHIPQGTVSLEKDVFPHILSLGLYGMVFDGLWVDCGTRESYLEAQRLLIGGRNVYCEGAEVSPLADLKDCTVLPGAKVGDRALIRRSIICPGAEVRAGEQVLDSIYLG